VNFLVIFQPAAALSPVLPARHRLAVAGDDDVLAGFEPRREPRQLRLRLVNIDRRQATRLARPSPRRICGRTSFVEAPILRAGAPTRSRRRGGLLPAAAGRRQVLRRRTRHDRSCSPKRANMRR